MYVYTYTRGCTSHSPAASQIYCTIIIINKTDLFNFLCFFYSFYVSLKCVIMQQHVSWKSRVCTRVYMHTLIYTKLTTIFRLHTCAHTFITDNCSSIIMLNIILYPLLCELLLTNATTMYKK